MQLGGHQVKSWRQGHGVQVQLFSKLDQMRTCTRTAHCHLAVCLHSDSQLRLHVWNCLSLAGINDNNDDGSMKCSRMLETPLGLF